MIGDIQVWLFVILSVACLVAAGWALIDCIIRPASAFRAAGKRTKNFWLAVTGIATVVAFLCLPYPIGLGMLPTLIGMFAAGAGILYLVDVRPAVRGYRPRGPRGPRSPRGGW